MQPATENNSTGNWREAFAHAEALESAPRDVQREAIARLEASDPLLARRVALMLGGETTHAHFDAAVTKVFGNARVKGEAAFKADDNIGAHTLIRSLGKGGMADVWLAQRTDGTLKRPVALKLPMAVMPSPILAERFARERDMLAQLDHPNIARIYDAGTTAQGQPFLALEFIDGEPLDHFCRAKKSTVNERVQLITQVAQAVHHAHSRLVLHRDLKPTNILVTREGVVKVLDFGIAKLLTEERTAEETQFTRMTGAALTPKYAAPEQCLGETVTTSTDVYALAVVLYELLAGCLPFESQAKDLSARMATLNIPCRLLAENAISAPQVEALQASSERGVKRALAGDLTAILDKALRRAPNDRYPSALAFADDLQRYLNNRPVLARKGALTYRVRKFLVRHRIPVAVAAMGAFAAAGLGLQAFTQSQRAAQSQSRADSIDGLMESLFQGMSPDTAPTRTFTAKELLDRAHGYLKARSTSNDDTLIAPRLGSLYRDIGAFKEARAVFQARSDAAIVAEQWKVALENQLEAIDAATKSGEFQIAEHSVEQALKLKSSHAELALDMRAQARLKNFEGQLALLYHNDSIAAKAHYVEAEKLLRTVVPIDVEQLIWSIEGQAIIARNNVQLASARAKMEEIEALDNLYPKRGEVDRLRSRSQLGAVLLMDGRYQEARSHLLAACDVLFDRLGGLHNETRVACRNAAFASTRSGQFEAAQAVLAKVRAVTPEADTLEHMFLNYQTGLIAFFSKHGQGSEAPIRNVIAYLEAQNNTQSSDARLRYQRVLGESLLRQNRNVEALAQLTAVVEEHRALRGDEHADVAAASVLLGISEIRNGNLSKAGKRLSAAHATLVRTRGAHHHFTASARAYAHLANPKRDDVGAIKADLAQLSWQPQFAQFVRLLDSEDTQNHDFRDIPIIF